MVMLWCCALFANVSLTNADPIAERPVVVDGARLLFLKQLFMLDKNICSLNMRGRPEALIKVLQGHVENVGNKGRLVKSAVSYIELS